MSGRAARVVISEFIDPGALESLRTRCEVHYDPALGETREALLPLLADADALIVRNRTRVDRALLDSAARLAVVGRLGVGLDNVDLETCAARQIAVIPATGANARAVAEYVLTTAMILLRDVYASGVEVADGSWPRTALSQGREILGKTLGLVGFGSIGQETARLAIAFGLRVIATDAALAPEAEIWSESGVQSRPLLRLLAEADVVSLHVPLLPKTRHLIDAAALSCMKPSAVLINSARGGVVDEAALADALLHRRIAGAALDVFEDEPLARGSPLGPLARDGNLILTPHIAGVTQESNVRVSTLIVDKVAACLEGLSARNALDA